MLSTILFTCVAHSSYRWPDSRFQHLTGTRPTNSSTGFSVGRNNQPGPPPTQSAAPFLIAENKRIKVPKIWVHVTQPSPPRLLSVGGRESHKSEHVVSISRLSPPPFHCGGPAPLFCRRISFHACNPRHVDCKCIVAHYGAWPDHVLCSLPG